MSVGDRAARRPSRWLVIYLRNHEAAASAGTDLFARTSRSQADRPWGPALVGVAHDVAEDLRTLRGLMRTWGVRPDPVSGVALRFGERVGRLKPNGRVVRRSPLSDLVEVEAGLDAVHAKASGWQALRAARGDAVPVHLDELARRADDQLERMRALHATVAAAVL
ncbi:hypothetical protein GCM10022197_31830 [Microlunatus spumicola]|uniref:Uncharacterized protein n=1 Tax=Microlunatus spumicola TaxID=81499 RepID=A0ABP6XV17_9ACTN